MRVRQISVNLLSLLLIAAAWLQIVQGTTTTIGFDASFTSSASPYDVTECDSTCTSPSTVTFSLSIVRSGDLTGTSTVYVSTRDSTLVSGLDATATADYTPLSNVAVVFAPSETLKTVVVTVISDGIYEGDEYFEAVLTNPSAGVALGTDAAVAYICIQDGGDGKPAILSPLSLFILLIVSSLCVAGIFSFNTSSYSFLESAGAVQLKILRGGGASGSVSVSYRTANPLQATAIKNKNYAFTDSPNTVEFAENQREGSVNLRIINDDVYTPNKFFYVQIYALMPMKESDPTQSVAKYGAVLTALVFILDDGDAGQFNFASPYIFCREDNGSAVVTIQRDLGTSTSSFAPVTLTVATVDSSGGSNATQGGSLAFDYLASSSSLSWADGEVKKTFAVKLFNNPRYDALTRSIKVRLSNVAGGATIGASTEMWIYIIDDRDAGTISFALSHYEVLENATSVSVQVTRSGLNDSSGINTYTSGAVTVDVATYAGVILPNQTRYDDVYDYGIVKARGCTHVSPCTAPEGVAYTKLPSTTLAFAAGESSKTVTVSILNNDLFQAPDLVFKILLQNVTGGAHLGQDYEHPTEWFGSDQVFLALDSRKNELLDNVGTIVTIQDDGDPAVILSKASVSTSEIGQFDAFRVHLNSQPTASVTLTFGFDSDKLSVNVSSLVFSIANWSASQAVKISAVPNNLAEGLHMEKLTITCTSSDVNYVAPLRTSLATTGFVIAAGVFTEKWGEYDTGNLLQAFPWPESSGVLTAPFQNASVAIFILDDDHAGVLLHPESIRFQSRGSNPSNFVSVRMNGHNATVGISLASEPSANVVISLVPSDNTMIRIEPASFVISPSSWANVANVTVSAIASATLAASEYALFGSVSVFFSSTSDAFFNQTNTPIERLFVQCYPPAQVKLDASVLVTMENGGSNANYTLQLASEPLHWEPRESTSTPFEFVVTPEADTTLTFPSSSSGLAGSAHTLTVASNASSSTLDQPVANVAAIRFNVRPAIQENTESSQVGLARLRLFRTQGGENNGLGGIKVGVTAAAVSAPDAWGESTLHPTCSSGVCSIADGAAAVSAFFPASTHSDNVSSLTDGEVVVTPTGAYDNSTNAFVGSSGWLEIDVTAALNRFLARNEPLTDSSSRNSITFLVYAKPVSGSEFVYDSVDQVSIASRENSNSSIQPQLVVVASGRVNLARAVASVSQSQAGTASAAIDGVFTSDIGVVSSYAMSPKPDDYPWWQADLLESRFLEDIVITISKKASAADMDESYLDTSFWVFLSDTDLSSNSNGEDGFNQSIALAKYRAQFNVSSRSFTTSNSETLAFKWHVRGENGTFGLNDYVSDYAAPIEARYLLIQVEGENSIVLNEVEIYQQAMASTRVSLGGFMPSDSVVRKGQNQIRFDQPESLQTPEDVDCDPDTSICRRELYFTSGNWQNAQQISVRVIDDAVASGDRQVLLTHTLNSFDQDYCGNSSSCSSLNANPCNRNLFNGSSVKPLVVLEDDENKVIFSTPTLQVVEGSGAYPTAPVFKRNEVVVPTLFRCSDMPDSILTLGSNSSAACVRPFDPDASSTQWTPCISNTSAVPLEQESVWMMVAFSDEKNVTGISLSIPKMASARYVRKLSVWWNAELFINSSTSDLLNISNGWTQIDSFHVAMKSSGSQVLTLYNLDLSPLRVLMVALESSYDDANQCLVAPEVEITAYEPIPFPLAIRGDLSSVDSVPPADSGLSRMHLYGNGDILGVRLASEPVADVLVSIDLVDVSDSVVGFEAANSSAANASLQLLTGANYSADRIESFRMPTALLFTPDNWNVSQEFTFLAVDDNVYRGDRLLSVSHTVESNDSTLNAIPVQTFNGQQLVFAFTSISQALSYTHASFIVSSTRSVSWPFNLSPMWTSANGNIVVTVVDDDLPGVTISSSQVIVSESGPVGNYSIALDSKPVSDVTITISYTVNVSLLTVAPLQLVFTTSNWSQLQFVFVDPVPNEIYDASEPFTLSYQRLILKAETPLLLHRVSSSDPAYSAIAVGSNEYDRSTSYVVHQGPYAIILDDDTGCIKEYSCQNDGVCLNATAGNVCQCPKGYGMKNCSAECTSASRCFFLRLEFLIQCSTATTSSVCNSTTGFSASLLAATLYRMLTSQTVTSPSGSTYASLALASQSEALYVVNNTAASCATATSDTCVLATVDFQLSSRSSSSTILNKLNAFASLGSLQSAPLNVQVMTVQPQFNATESSTIAVWAVLGVGCAGVAAIMSLFAQRWIKAKRSQVRPQGCQSVPSKLTTKTPDTAPAFSPVST